MDWDRYLESELRRNGIDFKMSRERFSSIKGSDGISSLRKVNRIDEMKTKKNVSKTRLQIGSIISNEYWFRSYCSDGWQDEIKIWICLNNTHGLHLFFLWPNDIKFPFNIAKGFKKTTDNHYGSRWTKKLDEEKSIREQVNESIKISGYHKKFDVYLFMPDTIESIVDEFIINCLNEEN